VIKWAGKNRRKRWVRAVMWPGLMLQNLTTREPDEEQLAVAIAALEKVLAEEKPAEADESPIEIVALEGVGCPSPGGRCAASRLPGFDSPVPEPPREGHPTPSMLFA
jgi:hypothetical protein